MEVEAKQVEILEQFAILAKGAKGRGLAQIIENATSEPNLFAFGELLDLPQVQQLQESDFNPALELLRLFAYGTWPQYKGRATQLPELSEKQILKLKQLTVMTLAETSKTLPYQLLMDQLDVGNVRALEDLLINDCMYAGIAKGKLDQQKRLFEVHFALGRDVRPGQLEAMTASIGDWLGACDSLLGSIEERIKWADETGQLHSQHVKEVEEMAKEMKRNISLSAEGVRDSTRASVWGRGPPRC